MRPVLLYIYQTRIESDHVIWDAFSANAIDGTMCKIDCCKCVGEEAINKVYCDLGILDSRPSVVLRHAGGLAYFQGEFTAAALSEFVLTYIEKK